MFRTIMAGCLAAVLSAGAAFAQATPAPSAPSAPAAPLAPAPRAVPRPAPAAIPAGTKINLNTATAQQLDALPRVGKARVKVIMDERAKGSFKDWDDFDKRTARTSVNNGVKSKIKDLVTF